MSNIILSINAGSSSLKVSIYGPTVDGPKRIAVATVSNIKAQAEFESSQNDLSDNERDVSKVKDHDSAFAHILNHLFRLVGEEDITHVCHRVVHGGDYENRVLITTETLHHLDGLSDLAPLHNIPSASLIRSTMKQLPHTKSIAYFDTTFHRTIPPHIYTFAFDQKLCEEYRLRKYGFHGLSYSFILRNVSEYLKKPGEDLNLILLHLGAGASACCVEHGRSLDTSMSLTPVDGLPGATRTGAIDPTVILHYMRKSGASIDDAESELNSKSGWKAMTGTSSFQDILASEEDKNKLALDLVVDRVMNYVGAYWTKLSGEVDALVFAGGIGERSPQLRAKIAEKCKCLGAELHIGKNLTNDTKEVRKTVRSIGEGKMKLLVVKTDEQYEMARQCWLDEELYG